MTAVLPHPTHHTHIAHSPSAVLTARLPLYPPPPLPHTTHTPHIAHSPSAVLTARLPLYPPPPTPHTPHSHRPILPVQCWLHDCHSTPPPPPPPTHTHTQHVDIAQPPRAVLTALTTVWPVCVQRPAVSTFRRRHGSKFRGLLRFRCVHGNPSTDSALETSSSTAALGPTTGSSTWTL